MQVVISISFVKMGGTALPRTVLQTMSSLLRFTSKLGARWIHVTDFEYPTGLSVQVNRNTVHGQSWHLKEHKIVYYNWITLQASGPVKTSFPVVVQKEYARM